jgi:hypothetical protein
MFTIMLSERYFYLSSISFAIKIRLYQWNSVYIYLMNWSLSVSDVDRILQLNNCDGLSLFILDDLLPIIVNIDQIWLISELRQSSIRF